MALLVTFGVLQLTAGVLSGWLMVAQGDAAWTRRLRIRAAARIRQGHIDLLMMGTLLVAIGVAVPGPQPVAEAAIAWGSWVGPLLFFPLAWKPELGRRRWYGVLDRLGFVALTIGFLVLAVDVLTR
ncbi:hypothetical protein [Actinomadura decatromicini]|uniref:Uncharacterized protein n=1 Tax=Actinomadura decatromicini TaxID=2604572 RepID=A0A5D3F5M3_9ACTN|nr:hypothetical protein [Actinomadura decatromicini]TYK43106.1 hypothetical protein FXF68_40225 [Actinomadura decatromicini]